MGGSHALVVGFGATGQAVAAALKKRGHQVTATDDRESPELIAAAEGLDLELITAPSEAQLSDSVRAADIVAPGPGIPEWHPVFAACDDLRRPVTCEFDLAAAWDDRPILAVTGTDGKTTVTTLVSEMLAASGVTTMAAGNTEVPLVTAIDDPLPDLFVVEASSFRLGHCSDFRPTVGTWLNFAADHLDVHRSIASYERAKARLWQNQEGDDVAVANADDPVVMRHARGLDRLVTFGRSAEFRIRGDSLLTSEGDVLARIDQLWSRLPHDVYNVLAASATALNGGASLCGVRDAIGEFNGLPHRVQFVGEWNGVRWFDDSKATAPHASRAALAGFDSVVLIAGGRNKGLDLGAMSEGVGNVRAVVGIGESAAEVLAAFEGVESTVADSMEEAVGAAAEMARSGDVVLLSPGCASFDWYRSYAERGGAFAAAVRRLHDGGTP